MARVGPGHTGLTLKHRYACRGGDFERAVILGLRWFANRRRLDVIPATRVGLSHLYPKMALASLVKVARNARRGAALQVSQSPNVIDKRHLVKTRESSRAEVIRVGINADDRDGVSPPLQPGVTMLNEELSPGNH